ncbi:filamentous hemagglutinin [Yokenella regensburgei]|uniref:Filamentous hemagglutinin n=2 Tax=Yokenella regensburgei TaxID=158877 RepID=A0ABX9RW59_9ENTR|nr:hemagglutinin repeat-containing protein [Yokenella regensburgei]RKR54241.1 filamentous hemagglutinin [Yokenella regensburgei]
MEQTPVSLTRRLLSYLISALLAGQPLLPAIGDALTPQGPTGVDSAANGVPVVNIATPNGAGVSHNQFQDYNVGKEGIILNNATDKLNQTQLGGIITGNPNLRPGQEAQAIINEVTGGNRSQLQGMTEVAGKAANVMVANPYGITCNGCGFINTPNATLTTGKPVFDANGNLQALDVRKGTITIEGKGIDASGSDSLSIISRATEINAQMHAKDLRVVAGANRVGADGSVQAQQGEGNAPTVAVDTGALGGMYANRIRLVSSEKGVGVNLGNLNARQGDITLDASGKLSVHQSLASGAIKAKGQEVALSGDHKAGGNIAVASQSGIALNGSQLVSDNNLQLSAEGKLEQNGGKLTAGQNIDLSASHLSQQGAADAGGNISLTGRESVNTRGNITAGKALSVVGSTLQNSGQLSAGDDVRIKGDSVSNHGVMQGKSLDIAAAGNVELNGQVNAAQALTVKGQQITSGSDAQIQSGQDLTLTAQTATLNGTHAAKNNFSVTANTLSHNGKANARTITLSAPDDLSNNGTLVADNLSLTSQHVSNGGLMQGNAALDLHTAKLDNLAGGSLYSVAALTLDIPALTNHGLITTDGDLQLNGSALVNGGEINGVNLRSEYATVNNEATGRLLADNALTMNGQRTDNAGLMAADSLALNSAEVNNGGKVLAVGELKLHNQTLDNGGLLQGNTLNIQANEWQNGGNALGEAGVTAAIRDGFTNQGNVLSQQAMTVHAGNIDNRGMLAAKVLALHGSLRSSGILQGDQALTWEGNHFSNLAGGQMTGGESLQLRGTRIENDGKLEGQSAVMSADSLRNGGTLQAQDSLKLTTTGRLDNQGELLSQNLFELSAAQLFNDNTVAAKSLTLTTPTLTNNGTVQGNSTLQLTTRQLLNGQQGQVVSGSGLDLRLDSLENHGVVLADHGFTLNAGTLTNSGDIQADSLRLEVSEALHNQGNLLAKQAAQVKAQTLENGGTLAGQTVSVEGQSLSNRGLVQGKDSNVVKVETLNSDATGRWLAGNALTIDAGTVGNAGVMQGNTVALNASSLNNSGVLNGLQGLEGNVAGLLSNQGTLQSGGAVALTAGTVSSSGRIAGDTLTLTATTLTNDGLWQGTQGLTLFGDTLTTGATSRTLSGGALTLNAGNITTQGTQQGQKVAVTADDWQHQGSLVSQGELTADVGHNLTTPGEMMSQGATSLTAQQLDNSGKILSEGDVTLDGTQLTNSGSVQGKSLTAYQDRIHNQGTLIGQQGLALEGKTRLMARMAMASPQRELINAAGGSLLTQGALKVTSGEVNNAGAWQGQSILLNAQSLANSGAIQSADALQLTLAKQLTSASGSKITALGNATLQALSLTNNGQWAAKNLTLKGESLDNAGAVSGVNGLTLAMSGAVNQQKAGSMLTAGALSLNAASVVNEGNIQGTTLGITSGLLTNSGRLQGDNGATLSLSDTLTNNAGGEIVSHWGLNVTTPTMLNYGLIQGGAETRLNATTRALNEGKVLSGAALTLTTPQYSGAGWLQATQLVLNAATATNSGNWLADSATLTGNTFTNQGITQAGQLSVNYAQLSNNGTLLGKTQLAVNADQVNQNAAGKLFSGGNLSLQSKGLNALGQVVALGDLTLKLANAFSANSTLAAGKTLSVTSDGDIDNRRVMQGQAVNLTAGGQLSNNGQITTGSGASTLSGSSVALNTGGTLQGGGDVTIGSRGNITVDGFTGTRGTLTLNSPGAIVNTALLYAANNLALYANSITNQHGDILAGNSLWMQKDAAGNANAEVINTSGTIETQNGDIYINTARLLNTRDGLKVSTTSQEFMPADQAQLNVSFASMGKENLGVTSDTLCSGGVNTHCTTSYWLVPTFKSDEKKVLISEQETAVSANGGAARIAAGGNLTANADTLNNESSFLLANGNITLRGQSLNNASAETGKQSVWQKFTWSCAPRCETKYDPFPALTSVENWLKGRKRDPDSGIKYTLSDTWTEYTPDGQQYRSVIQAGGNVTASFASDISNTTTSANSGRISNTLVAPTLNSLSNQTIGDGVQKQALEGRDSVSVGTPQWNDRLQSALQQINGGGALDGGSVPDAALNTLSGVQKSDASLGTLNGPVNPGSNGVNVSGQNHGKTVDTSAYPLPSGQNGYFVVSDDPKSPYLINLNPKLNGLGELDPNLFADLNALLGIKPDAMPRETNSAYTDQKQFLGSAWMLGRLNLNPDRDYRFLGDAAFDTRYVSNAMLNQTGSRYLKGIGSELDQMRYLMDNAASVQQSLGLTFGVSLTADQIAALDKSMLWWEAATINGEQVMIPKLYLSAKDVTVNHGSVISGDNVQLAGGNITNAGSAILANKSLTLDGQNSINNLDNSLMQAGGNLDLSAIGDINNISSTISGKTVALESLDGSINNLTLAEQLDINAQDKYRQVVIKDTLLGTTASITAQDGLSMLAGKDITATGAKIAAGGSLLMNAWGDIALNANQLNEAQGRSGRGLTGTSSGSVSWQGNDISAGGNLGIKAGHDLNVTASDLSAGKSAQLVAGNDLNLNAAETSQNNRRGSSETHQSGVDRTTVSAGENVVLAAGRDLTSQAAGIAAEDNVAMQAGRDVNLLAQETASGSSTRESKKTVIDESVRQQGTEVASGGNTTIVAGRDLNAQAAQVTAQGDITAAAGRDVNLTTATESDYHYKEETKTKKGFLSKKTTHTIEEDSATREAGTLLSGNNVRVQAGNDLLVKGSSVVGDDAVNLHAGNNVDIVAATNTDSSWRFKEEKKSGLMGTGGIGFTIGSSKSTHDLREAGTTQSQSFSTVGSTGGSVAISAGKQAHMGGADLVAQKDLSLSGDSVIIEPGHDKRTRDETFEQKKSGLTVALSGTVGSAINNAVTSAQETKETSDGRLKALQATKTALSGVQAGQAAAVASATGDPNAMGVSLSLTTQKSKTQQHAESDAVSGSTLNAGNNLAIVANGKQGGANSGDIVIAGSQLKAGGDTLLSARNDILLSGAANTQQSSGKNSSSGGGIGVSIGAGGGGAGISVFANVNAANGKDKGNGTDWTETTLDSGKSLTINSGRDTVLNGAQVSADKITADIGRDLLISSQQDNNNYDSKQTSVAAGGSFTFGSMSGSGYISASQDKMKSRFDSVAEQSGLFAGNGGFDITVGNHTQLDGAVIASTATADKNSLDTGTLGFSDIHNEADFKTQHSGISLSGGGAFGGDQFKGNMPGGMISAAGNSGHAEGTTQAAVADGTITVRNKDKQQQDVANLSRDTEHANDSISPIFDKEKEQNRLKAVGLISDIGGQAADIARTQGELSAIKTAKDRMDSVTPEDKARAQAQWQKDNPGKTAKPEDISNQIYQNYYNEAFNATGMGTGGTVQRGIQAATAALTTLAGGGNLSGALAGASAPELAHLLKEPTEGNTAVNAIAHAILGGTVAAIQGNSAAAGASGAASGELVAKAIAEIYYPGVKMSELTENQKQTISSLASISAGIAGGIASGNTAGAAAGASAGKNAVENNSLSGDQARAAAKQAAESLKNQVREKLGEGTTSAIANAIINGLADTGDAALGSADYAADAAMALASCAAGDSYCSKAMSDLAGKNQAVADTVTALMQGETWSAVADTVKQAAGGNQAALEATGGLLASIMLPGKKIPGSNIVAAENVTKTIIDSKKFDYLFGNVTSGSHNAERSTQLAQTMDRLGLETNSKGVDILTEHFNQVVNTKGNVIDTYTKGNQSFEVRESLLFGPSGKATKLETSFEVMPDGSRRFITTIPKEGKK